MKECPMDFPQTLQVSLSNLRHSWPEYWPGMDAVLQGCLGRLGLTLCLSDPEVSSWYRCTRDLALWLDQDGEKRRQDGLEPGYHNRLHTADTLVCLTLLLQAQRQFTTDDSAAPLRHERLSLLAMLAHDLLHDGGVNQFPAQLETRSVQALSPLMQRHGMPPSDQALVRHLILKTDAQVVSSTHALIADRPFTAHDVDCLAVLVQEADVMASTLSSTGHALTKNLAAEWAQSNPTEASRLVTPEGRLRFLERAALFSSPASLLLGVQSARQNEMLTLRQSLGY
jgi:hypothetical protein